MRHIACLCAFLSALPGAAHALVPEFAAPARITETTAFGLDSYQMPIGPFAGGQIATRRVEGALSVTAYQIDSNKLTTLEILASLRDQVTAAGYEVEFECAASACGGFDFRFATRVIAEPAMHVDLADFRFLAATRDGADGPEAISLLVSRSALLGFAQVIEVGALVQQPDAPVIAPVTEGITAAPEIAVPPLEEDSLGAALQTQGSVALEDVDFDSGASVLAGAELPSLTSLANWLRADATRQVVIVGHTDASGGLAANVALGAKRAEAVRERLVGALGVSPGQVTAAGAGFLAPRASNMTEEGRRLNRRVEVVLLPAAQ
jgi:outer membrane protein OmpA-like peptidoglycan-associated protein